MATVTITLTDNPADHSVSVHSSFTPAVGNKCSPAQAAAMDIIMSTTRQWGSVKTTAQAVQVANYGATEGAAA